MTLYDLSTIGGGFWNIFNTLVVASHFVLLDVLLVSVFLCFFAIFTGSQRSSANTILIASLATFFFAAFTLFWAVSSAASATEIGLYTARAMVTFGGLIVMALYNMFSGV